MIARPCRAGPVRRVGGIGPRSAGRGPPGPADGYTARIRCCSGRSRPGPTGSGGETRRTSEDLTRSRRGHGGAGRRPGHPCGSGGSAGDCPGLADGRVRRSDAGPRSRAGRPERRGRIGSCQARRPDVWGRTGSGSKARRTGEQEKRTGTRPSRMEGRAIAPRASEAIRSDRRLARPAPVSTHPPPCARYASTMRTLGPARRMTASRVSALDISSSCSATNHWRKFEAM